MVTVRSSNGSSVQIRLTARRPQPHPDRQRDAQKFELNREPGGENVEIEVSQHCQRRSSVRRIQSPNEGPSEELRKQSPRRPSNDSLLVVLLGDAERQVHARLECEEGVGDPEQKPHHGFADCAHWPPGDADEILRDVRAGPGEGAGRGAVFAAHQRPGGGDWLRGRFFRWHQGHRLQSQPVAAHGRSRPGGARRWPSPRPRPLRPRLHVRPRSCRLAFRPRRPHHRYLHKSSSNLVISACPRVHCSHFGLLVTWLFNSLSIRENSLSTNCNC